MEENAGGGHKPFSGKNRGGMTGGWQNLRGECCKQREGIMTRGADLRKGGHRPEQRQRSQPFLMGGGGADPPRSRYFCETIV